jgi:hypothetical protein
MKTKIVPARQLSASEVPVRANGFQNAASMTSDTKW